MIRVLCALAHDNTRRHQPMQMVFCVLQKLFTDLHPTASPASQVCRLTVHMHVLALPLQIVRSKPTATWVQGACTCLVAYICLLTLAAAIVSVASAWEGVCVGNWSGIAACPWDSCMSTRRLLVTTMCHGSPSWWLLRYACNPVPAPSSGI